MSSVSLDSRILEQIIELLSGLKIPDALIQRRIYRAVEVRSRSLPDFCFYLLHIAQTSDYPRDIRKISLLALRRYFQKLREDLVPIFLKFFLTFLETIITSGDKDLGLHGIVILAELVVAYGSGFVSNLTEMFRQMLGTEEFAAAVLDAMNILANRWPDFPIEWAEDIPRFLQGEFAGTCLCSEALAVWRALMNSDPEKWCEFFKGQLHLIFENFDTFQTKGAVEAMCIVADFFGKTGDVFLADFLVCCIQTQDRMFLSEMLELIDTYPELPFHEPFVLALFSLLDDEEGDVGEYSVLEMAGALLQKLFVKYGDVVLQLVESVFDKCTNPCQILRAIWLFASVASDSEHFLKYLDFVRKGLDSDECRGDAVLCLYYIASDNESLVEMATNDIITRALPDSRAIVRDKVFFALIELMDVNMPKDRNWLVQLVRLYDEYLGEQDGDSAYFIRLRQIIETFCGNTDTSDPIYEELYSKLVGSFLAMKSTDSPILFDGFLISALQAKLRPTFCEASNNILIKMGDLAPVLLLDDKGFNGYCMIMECFTCAYPEATWNNDAFVRAAKLLTERVMTDENHDCDLCSFFSFVKSTLLRFPVHQTEIGNVWMQIAQHGFNGFGSIEAINAIADTYLNVVETMSPEELNAFAVASVDIMEIWGHNLELLPAVLPFVFKLLTVKREKGLLQTELNEVYELVCNLQRQCQPLDD